MKFLLIILALFVVLFGLKAWQYSNRVIPIPKEDLGLYDLTEKYKPIEINFNKFNTDSI